MREFIRHLPRDKTSALHRALHPDEWMWADIDTLLLAETATAVTDLRWLEAVGRVAEDEMPKRWEMRRYGPDDPGDEEVPDHVSEETAAIVRARAAAAEILG